MTAAALAFRVRYAAQAALTALTRAWRAAEPPTAASEALMQPADAHGDVGEWADRIIALHEAHPGTLNPGRLDQYTAHVRDCLIAAGVDLANPDVARGLFALQLVASEAFRNPAHADAPDEFRSRLMWFRNAVVCGVLAAARRHTTTAPIS